MTLRSNSPEMDSTKLFYSNDSFSIQYDFYGTSPKNDTSVREMRMHIYNKLDKPLIIDWGQSSDIIGSKTYNYLSRPNQFANIPPKTSIDHSTYIFLQTNFLTIPMKKSYKQKVMTPNSDGGDSFVISETDYNISNTTFIFRNYLALSYDASLNTRFYLDHQFWVSSVRDMKVNDFNGTYTNLITGNSSSTYPFLSTNCFLISYEPVDQ